MKNGYNYDALNNALTISASFAKKASRIGSPEYNTILKLRREFPDVTITLAEKKEGTNRLTYAQIEKFLAAHRNADELKAMFEKIKSLSHAYAKPYTYVKNWFDNNFPYYYDDEHSFDEDGYVIAPKAEDPAPETVEETVVEDTNVIDITPMIDKAA